MKKYILAIDQGTSSTKTLIFDEQGEAVAKGTAVLATDYLENGFVEQDPEGIYRNVLDAVESCINDFKSKRHHQNDIAGIGISNQRETFIIWDESGKPLNPAVVWQCKRSVDICERLREQGLNEEVAEKTGLIIDPYFSATKLIWLVENNPEIAVVVKSGKAYFGTVDTWLLWKFTEGKVYATDYTNASRTLLFNLNTLEWDQGLIEFFSLSGINLPEIKPSSAFYGETTLNELLNPPIPITAMIGDSHAAAFGEGCFEAGTAKATLGTGCSVMMNIGPKPLKSVNGMVTTVCWSTEDKIDFAFEGVIVSCGATIEWLKNELNLITDSKETEAMANAVPDNGGVYLIPAFSGLGSPHWQMDRKASINGLTFGSTKNHIVRAALESIPYQIKDVITAMEKDAAINLKEINVDGGITANQFVVQSLANILQKNVATIGMSDVSALGAGLLAGLKVGVYENIESLKLLNGTKKYYFPENSPVILESYKQWQLEINSQ